MYNDFTMDTPTNNPKNEHDSYNWSLFNKLNGWKDRDVVTLDMIIERCDD
jgi:hypothetical protein